MSETNNPFSAAIDQAFRRAGSQMRSGYDPKTDAILEHTGSFGDADFLRFAAACLDQAGASVEELREYVDLLTPPETS